MPQPQRIVIDARESGRSTGRYVDKLIEHLHVLQPNYEVVIVTRPERIDYFKKISPTFVAAATPFKEFTFGEQIGFRSQLESLKPALMHFGIVQQPVLYKGLSITTMHDLTTTRFRNPAKNWLVFTVKQIVYKWVNKRVARTSARIIVPTNFVRDDVVRFTGINSEKITVTYEAADHVKDPARRVQSLHGDDFILYVGRPQPHKNLDRLVQAFMLLKQDHPHLKLVFAGKKDVLYEQLERRAKAVGLNDVVFTDFVSDGQLRWLYENCQAYVFPSLSEGFGLPGLEAMMHGAPVVSSNATCLPEVHGDAVLYFDPLDVRDMAAKIASVIDDKNLRTRLIRAGTKQAAKYSWRRMAQQTLDIYDAVLKANTN